MTEQSLPLRPRRLFRHPDTALPTVLAITYSLVAYAAGLYGVQALGAGFVLGVLLLAHAMVIAAFLLHECAHGALFVRPSRTGPDPHRTLAIILGWLSGCCYSEFSALRNKHLRHHFEHADIVAVDYRRILQQRPLLRRVVVLGQWLCLPAVELLFHWWAIWRPLTGGDPGQRRRVAAVLVLRLAFFATLVVLVGWTVIPGYALAYLIFVSVMGFMDAFQHQYLLLFTLAESSGSAPQQSKDRTPGAALSGAAARQYEQLHTFSNLLSRRWPPLNWLVLNFCYHNAHHHRPAEPWWRLPEWHRQIAQSERPPTEIPLWQQLRVFFRYRVARVMAPATDQVGAGIAPGATGVSFLTPL